MAPAGCCLSTVSYAAPRQRLARRIARWTARCARRLAQPRMLRDGPGGLPDGSLGYRFGGWFEVCPASCPTARSWRFGGGFDSRQARPLAQRLARGASANGLRRARRLARRLARGASVDGSVKTGPGVLPGGSLALVRFGGSFDAFGACQTARAITASQVT